jgi:hypothetical protein
MLHRQGVIIELEEMGLAERRLKRRRDVGQPDVSAVEREGGGRGHDHDAGGTLLLHEAALFRGHAQGARQPHLFH